MEKLEKEVVKKCGSLNKDDCLKAVLHKHLVQNVRHEQILVLIPKQGGVPEAVCTAIGWNRKSTKNATTLRDMINVDEVSTSPSEWLCVLLLLKKPEPEDPQLVGAMEYCYMVCVTHACDTGDPWVPWMLPYLPGKHKVNLNNLLITALSTHSPAAIEQNIDTMQVVKGVVLFFKNPNTTFFTSIFPTSAQWNAHALNLWISLLIMVNVTEGYQVYLKCLEWATKSEISDSKQFQSQLEPHLQKIGKISEEWQSWQTKILNEMLKNGVKPLLESLPLTDLFRIKGMFYKPLIDQLTKTAIDKKTKEGRVEADKDPTRFAASKKLPKNTEEVEKGWWGWGWDGLTSLVSRSLVSLDRRTQLASYYLPSSGW